MIEVKQKEIMFNSKKYCYKKLSSSNIKDIMQLYAKVFNDFPELGWNNENTGEDFFEKNLNNEKVAIVGLYDNSKLIAATFIGSAYIPDKITLWKENFLKPARINRFAVDPLLKGTGVSGVLFSNILETLSQNYYDGIRLQVVTRNPGAKKFYEKFEFKLQGIQGDEFCLERSIEKQLDKQL